MLIYVIKVTYFMNFISYVNIFHPSNDANKNFKTFKYIDNFKIKVKIKE